MKIFLTTLILVAAATASALDYTIRGEIRDDLTSSSSCGNKTSCGTSSMMGFGVGVTSKVFSFSERWGFYTGALLRQRSAQTSPNSSAYGVTQWDLDLPLMAQWDFAEKWSARLGLNLGILLNSTDAVPNGASVSANWTDNSVIYPIELAVDWKLSPARLVYLAYESGTALAAGSSGNPSLATSAIISLGVGGTF